MRHRTRRGFLADVGRGMLIAGVGYQVALDLGLSEALADEGSDRLTFGRLEPLVCLMQETPIDNLLPVLVERIHGGTPLADLVSAAALANARTFGGEDYIGFHTLMALGPALAMSNELPQDRKPLPVLKVLYRNTARLHEHGGPDSEVLRPVQGSELTQGRSSGELLRDAIHRQDVQAAEGILAASAARSPEEGYNDLLLTVQEHPEVHRVVLAHRVWDMLSLVGLERAETMLRQSVRFCVKGEPQSLKYASPVRELLPKLLDQYGLLGAALDTRAADDAWIDATSRAIFESSPDRAADIVAAALSEGIERDGVAAAISLAANQLVLRDAGRPANQAQENKPIGSVHGDSIGVHACDSAHAWRGIARVSNTRNSVASLILSGYHLAQDRTQRGGDFLNWQARPHDDELGAISATDGESLLTELDGAIREQNQDRACALVHVYGEQGYDARGAFDVLLKYATSEDGALHAEKYYRTVSDEFAAARPAFRWRQVVALARVTASEYGRPAPGYAEACKLLNV